MNRITRRSAVLGALTLPVTPAAVRAADRTRVRFTLDWKHQGVHAWFYVAKEKGYFAEEGLQVEIDQGEGSAAAVSRIVSGTYDAGFGDINAVIAAAARTPERSPRIVYQMYNRGPYVVAVRADGPIKNLADLPGRSLGAPAGSASARLFPLLARLNGVDPASVNMQNVAANLQEQLLASERIDGILGFNYSIYVNLRQTRLDPDTQIRWFTYSDHGLDLYSNGVIASQEMIARNPGAVRGLVRAIHRGLATTIEDVGGAIRTMKRIEPLLDEDIERRRLEYTLRNVLGTAWTKENGFGGVDGSKLEASIKAVVEGYELPRRPASGEVFDPAFLPGAAERRLQLPG